MQASSVYRNIDDTNLTSDFAFADDYLKKIYHDNSVSSEIKNNFLYKELRLAILQLNIKKTQKLLKQGEQTMMKLYTMQYYIYLRKVLFFFRLQ